MMAGVTLGRDSVESNTEATAWRRVGRVALLVVVSAVLPGKRHDPPRTTPYGLDKLAHAAGHATLSATLFDALRYRQTPRRAATLAIVVSGGSSLFLELGQRWVPGRRYEHGDVLAGIGGSLVGVVVVSRNRACEDC